MQEWLFSSQILVQESKANSFVSFLRSGLDPLVLGVKAYRYEGVGSFQVILKSRSPGMNK